MAIQDSIRLAVLVGITGVCGVASAQSIPTPAGDLLRVGTASISDGSGFGGTADKLNDGNRDGAFYFNSVPNSVAHSAGNAADHYMQVLLPAATSIGSVIVFNRGDGVQSRIDGGGSVPFEIVILNGSQVQKDVTGLKFVADISLAAVNGDPGSGMTIDVGNVLGDTVRIIQHNADYLNLAELEAYAPVPEPGSLALLAIGGGAALLRRRRRH